MDMPMRGEKYSGPEGKVEVVAVDGAVEEVVTVRPEGGGEEQKVPLQEWRTNYVYSPGEETELTQRAREGYDAEGAEGVQEEQ